MNTTTLDKMRKLRLLGMYRAFKTNLENEEKNEFTNDELINFLIDAEWDDRHNRFIDRRLKNAHFRYKASVEQFYFDKERNFDKNQFMRLADCSFIQKKENVLITGSTGAGKSYIASALGNQACIEGYNVMYFNAGKLFAQLKMAKADGSWIKETRKIEKQDLLILDDFGIQPLDAQSRSLMMDIIEDRHGKSSTIITSQLPVKQWYDIIGEKTIADAILDRIVHDSQRIELKGESLRIKTKNENQN